MPTTATAATRTAAESRNRWTRTPSARAISSAQSGPRRGFQVSDSMFRARVISSCDDPPSAKCTFIQQTPRLGILVAQPAPHGRHRLGQAGSDGAGRYVQGRRDLLPGVALEV